MKIVILGSNGRLGTALMRAYCTEHEVIGYRRLTLDIENLAQVRAVLHGINFDLLINCAAHTNVDLCEKQRDRAFLINAEAPHVLAELCRHKKAKMIHFSTDYVFDGEKRQPYAEDDFARPLSVYGESKLEGEKLVLRADPRHLVVRVSWVFGPDRPSFIDGIIKRAMENDQVDAIADKFSTPTYTHDIAEMLPFFFARKEEDGIVHFCNAGECSWQEYGQHALDCCRARGLPLRATRVAPLKMEEMKNFIARRPVYTVLSTEKYRRVTSRSPRPWREAVSDYIEHSYSKT